MKSTDWIKVEDRLPERDGKHNWTKNVLVYCPGPSGYDGEPKAENEELKTLNKNLIEITYNQKAKKHGKATKPRKCED